MRTDAVDAYVAAFRARCEVVRRPGRAELDEPGAYGLLSSREDPDVRLVVTDDRAYDLLAEVLPDARAGMIVVMAEAARSLGLVESRLAWKGSAATAMACPALAGVPAFSLPNELTLRGVKRLDGDPDGVPLDDAVAVAVAADPGNEVRQRELSDYLRSLPPTYRLFAAVAPDGSVRATSASGVAGVYANVIFVNTDRDWRRRGIGRAMTSAALDAARGAGATQACLDASAVGRPIYEQLGFEVAGEVTRFFRRRSDSEAPSTA